MRRLDKLKNIKEINQRMNESKFDWDGNYANEEQVESTVNLGDDIETTDTESNQWFSDEEGDMLVDE